MYVLCFEQLIYTLQLYKYRNGNAIKSLRSVLHVLLSPIGVGRGRHNILFYLLVAGL